tara:strand:+ start:470 stop:688 length:219 start_codon:yes stop_codon:yes gene_type:complete
MEDLINESIIENISEEYQIYKMTCETIPTKYVIRDGEGELVRHNNMTFFSTKADADKALAEIVYERFEEVSQ